MPRYRLTLEYDGRGFLGWQRQDNGLSVQAVLEDAILKLTGTSATAVAAGRTDAGVHALAQVAHADLAKPFPAERVIEALNFHMKPHSVAVLDAVETGPDFHARFSATRRRYRYRIVNRRAHLTVDRGLAWRVGPALDAAAMHGAAQALVGRYDFTTFRAAQCQAASPLKTLDRLDVRRAGQEVVIEAEARSFLHHQVRSIVGSLRLVGEGKWSAEALHAALAAADRARCGPVAPPDGLYLVEVRYDAQPPGLPQ
jgi:tRNA pseudouridine38-40 synthase